MYKKVVKFTQQKIFWVLVFGIRIWYLASPTDRSIRTKMKKYKVLGDLGNVIQALDEIDQDKLLKTGVNEIINIHMKILKNQQRELKNLTKELKKEVKSPNKKVIL